MLAQCWFFLRQIPNGKNRLSQRLFLEVEFTLTEIRLPNIGFPMSYSDKKSMLARRQFSNGGFLIKKNPKKTEVGFLTLHF
mgnify:CR=1 FL=1